MTDIVYDINEYNVIIATWKDKKLTCRNYNGAYTKWDENGNVIPGLGYGKWPY
ncbi:MAG: hypothetical protein AAFO15_00240 [Pseudomonadota bacterium]